MSTLLAMPIRIIRKTSTIELSLEKGCDNEMVVQLSDNGRYFNPMNQADPDIDSDFDKRSVGGLGIYLVKKVMDEVYYQRLNNKNFVKMKKMI